LGGTKATAYGRGRLLGCFRDTLALFDGLGWVLKKQKTSIDHKTTIAVKIRELIF